MATMQRSFIRAGISLKYSEGFNPHPYMSVALPLSVGCESLCELIDVAVVDDITPDVKSIELPDGITIIDAYLPKRKFNDIAWIEICGKFYYNRHSTTGLSDSLLKRLKNDSLVISKKTKRGNSDLDIAQYIKSVEITAQDGILS